MANVLKMPRPKRDVTNDEFNAALANGDNRSVIRSITNRYARSMGEGERETCGLMGLWRALQYHQDGFDQKFTTTLSRFVRWECNRLHKWNHYDANHGAVPLDDQEVAAPFHLSEEAQNLLTLINDRMQLLSHDQQEMIREHFYDGRTLDEMGEMRGIRKEAARQRLDKAIERLKALCEVEGLATGTVFGSVFDATDDFHFPIFWPARPHGTQPVEGEEQTPPESTAKAA